MFRKLFVVLLTGCLGIFWSSQAGYAQQFDYPSFSRADSLRGSLNVFRSCFDVHFYDLQLRIDPAKRRIQGSNTVHFEAVNSFRRMQLDLFKNLRIDSITGPAGRYAFERQGNAFFIDMPKRVQAGQQMAITVWYGGQPTEAVNPPWDGGFSWEKDKRGRHWVGVSCEGVGASLWWPNKDHLSEEPDSMRMRFEVPKALTCVANGNLQEVQKVPGGYKAYTWFVQYPINNYNVTLNIAHYTHFEDVYVALDGDSLALDYYVLDYNKAKAVKHFEQVKPMLRAFEVCYGKYPYWQDGYALVETSYWGMEHQGAIAYGNEYKNNAYDFDFIIIHESGHEYWGNSVSAPDHAELWIHESFCTYSEAQYLEETQGYAKMIKYLMKQRDRVQYNEPVLGPLGVNYTEWEDSDMYFKGTWMLHSMRYMFKNKEAWYAAVRALYQEFKHSHATTAQITHFLDEQTPANLQPVFDQYLLHALPPALEYYFEKTATALTVHYRWNSPVADFNLPVFIAEGNKESQKLTPSTRQWQSVRFAPDSKLSWDLTKGLYDVRYMAEQASKIGD